MKLSFRFHRGGGASKRRPWLLGRAHISVRILRRLRLTFEQASHPVPNPLEPAVVGMVCHGAPSPASIALFPPCRIFSVRHRSDTSHPRPMNGIFVAITVRNRTFASSGRLAM
jgi:hypothetical protein